MNPRRRCGAAGLVLAGLVVAILGGCGGGPTANRLAEQPAAAVGDDGSVEEMISDAAAEQSERFEPQASVEADGDPAAFEPDCSIYQSADIEAAVAGTNTNTHVYQDLGRSPWRRWGCMWMFTDGISNPTVTIYPPNSDLTVESFLDGVCVRGANCQQGDGFVSWEEPGRPHFYERHCWNGNSPTGVVVVAVSVEYYPDQPAVACDRVLTIAEAST